MAEMAQQCKVCIRRVLTNMLERISPSVSFFEDPSSFMFASTRFRNNAIPVVPGADSPDEMAARAEATRSSMWPRKLSNPSWVRSAREER